MNRSQEIVDYLTAQANPCTVVLAPNAPPVVHALNEVRVVLPLVLSAGDIFDTLLALKAMTARRELDLDAGSGTFSISLRKVGRVRVAYLTQRGSKVVTVARIPFDIPDLSTLCGAATAEALLELAKGNHTGIMAVSGPDPILNSTLVYALLDKLNHSERTIIGVVESPLCYLMNHRNSIVVQCEVGTDVATLKEGVDSLLVLAPRFLYIGGVRTPDELALLGSSVQSGRLIVLSSIAVDATVLVERLLPPDGHSPAFLAEALKGVVHVARAGDGTLNIRIG